jgi:glycerate 2-kinase
LRHGPLGLVGSQAHALTRSLHALRTDLLDIVRAGIRAIDPAPIVASHLREGPWTRVHVIAAGKAAAAMAAAAERALGALIHQGVVVTPGPSGDADSRLQWLTAAHPIPTPQSEAAGRWCLEIAQGVGVEDQLLVLLSGGASALMVVPADGVTLADKGRTTDVLLRAGADIRALNTVRKHLSAIKGGALALASRGDTRTLAISDVVGDDLSVIASGPTVPDASTFQEAVGIVRRFGGEAAFPAAVVSHLRSGAAGEIADTPKPGDPRLSRASAHVIASRHDAMRGAAAEAKRLGYQAVVVANAVVGEASAAAPAHFAAQAARIRDDAGPVCIISSGETVVHVKGPGRGGRNQEFVLALAPELRGIGRPAAAASVGTDGIDGPTDAAGALADATTLERAAAAGADYREHLRQNDTYTFFARLGDLIHTGPTGTNVGDLQIMLFDRI